MSDTTYRFSIPINFASEETSEVGESMLVTYKDAVIAVGGPTEPEAFYDFENGEESVRRLDVGPAIESEAVFASRMGSPEGVPVYISHDPSLSIGRVTDIRYGQHNGSPALLADLELMQSSPDPRTNHVLQGIQQKIGIGLSMGLDPSTIKLSEDKQDDGSQLVSFNEFGIREVSLTPEPRIPGAHLFSLSSNLKENRIMSNSIPTTAPARPVANSETVLERIEVVAREPQGPSNTDLANERVFSYLENVRSSFSGQSETVNHLFRLGEEYRQGRLQETEVYSQATTIAQRAGSVEGLARDGSNPQGEARTMANRIVETVPNFSLANLLDGGMRRRSNRSYSNDELDVMGSLQQEFPNMAGAGGPSGSGTHIPMPTAALMRLVAERQGVNFGQTYGASTIDGQTGSAQIDESRSPDYARNLLARFLRPSNVATGLGVTTVPVTRDIIVPIQTSGTSAGWLGENASAAAQAYDVDTQQSSPRRLAAQGYFSWQLEASEGTGDSLGSYMLLIDDLNRGVNQQKELALFGGSGASGQPTGVLRTTGINAITINGTPTWSNIASFVTPIMTANIDSSSAAWVTTPRWYQVLRTTLQSASANSIFLSGNAAMEQGRSRANLDGFPLYVTNNLPRIGSGNNEDVLLLGVFSELLDIQYARAFMTIDDTSNAGQAYTTVTYNGYMFIITRRPKAFSSGSHNFGG